MVVEPTSMPACIDAVPRPAPAAPPVPMSMMSVFVPMPEVSFIPSANRSFDDTQ